MIQPLYQALKRWITLFVEERTQESQPNCFLPKEAEVAGKIDLLFDLLKQQEVPEKIQTGLELLLSHITTSEKDYSFTVNNLSKVTQAVQIYRKEERLPGSLQDLLGLHQLCLEQIYEISNDLFLEKKYEQASSVLFLLTLLNPFVQAYWVSLGVTKAHLGLYEKALVPFSIASLLNEKDPAPHIFACDCYFSLGDLESVAHELQLAEKRVDQDTTEQWKIPLEEIRNLLNKAKKR